MDIVALGYIDPNTSQHIFNLLGPILALLTATGGLAATAIVFVRHRIVSYCRKTSWVKRAVTVSMVVGVLVIMAAVTWWIIR